MTKLTAVHTGTKIWDRVSMKPFDEVDMSPETRALLQPSMIFTPWFVTLPVSVFGGLAQVVASGGGDEVLVATLRRPPTAIDNMNPRNPGLRLVQSIPVASRIQAHSIIALKGDGPNEEGADGVVVYKSAHTGERRP